jgi:anti-sigma factor RsiW
MNDIREDDLHAYVDGGLDDARRLEVESWLAGHPEDAERVRDWEAQNRALHHAFDPVLNEPLPLDLVHAASGRRHRLGRLWRSIAAVLALAATGLAGYGIGVRSARPPTLAQLPRDAAAAYAVFTPERRHPVEVDAAHADHLVAWLSNRLGSRLSAPDFTAEGFALLGGRLLSGGGGPVAQFMYQDTAGHRVTLYIRRDVRDGRDTAFRHAVENGVEVFYWIDRDLGYALSGQIGHADMQRLAEAAYRQIGR